MTDRGRHSRRSGVGFYKDVLFLLAGILIVGAIVFGGLSLWAGRDSGTTTTSTTVHDAASTTTSVAAPSSSSRPTTTTSPPSTTESTAPPTTIREVRPPSEVRVVVLNSTTVTGLAADLTAQLGGLGYQMSEPTNYSPELSDTMIFHADGFSLEALEMVEAIPDGTVAANQELAEDQGVDIVVVIGLSYQE